jgi:FkbM family methyltransferase
VLNKVKTAFRLLLSGDLKAVGQQVRQNAIHLSRTRKFRINGVEFELLTEGENFEMMEMPEELNSLAQFHAGEFECVIVAGAHTGRDPLYFSGIARRVIALEPHPQNFQRLKSNVELNQRTNIDLLNKAVSDVDGTLDFAVGHGGLSETGTTVIGGAPQGTVTTISVPAASLDSLLPELNLPKTGKMLLWMDIEGAELKAFSGATAFLREYRPVVHVEIHPVQLRQQGRSPDDVRAQLAGLGYSNYKVAQKSGELHAIALPDPA